MWSVVEVARRLAGAAGPGQDASAFTVRLRPAGGPGGPVRSLGGVFVMINLFTFRVKIYNSQLFKTRWFALLCLTDNFVKKKK